MTWSQKILKERRDKGRDKNSQDQQLLSRKIVWRVGHLQLSQKRGA